MSIVDEEGISITDVDGDFDFESISGGDNETNGTIPNGYYLVTLIEKYGGEKDYGGDNSDCVPDGRKEFSNNGYFFKLTLTRIDEKLYEKDGTIKKNEPKAGSGFNRTKLLIHPSDHTLGCIGLKCSKAQAKRFYKKTTNYMKSNGGKIILKVKVRGINGRASVQKGEPYKN